MGDLIDPDSPQTGEQVGFASRLLCPRSQIAPTLRQAIRISSATALPKVLTASPVTCCSKARVKRESCRAQGYGADDYAVLVAVDPGICLEVGDGRVGVEHPPALSPLTEVEAQGTATADAAAAAFPMVRP